jgi:pyridoxine 5-phosphate synthase
MTLRLHVNIDHVATLRNQRDTVYPDVVEAARCCLQAGAHGITVHLREDRRHIRDADVVALRSLLSQTPRPGTLLGTLNLEMAATREMARVAAAICPDVITLVPEKREERTTEGGLDLRQMRANVEEVARAAQAQGVKLSLFIEALPEQIRLAQELNAAQVEFHTGHYAEAEAESGETTRLLAQFSEAARLAHELGLEVAAGHGLTTTNVVPLLRIPHLVEFNIGHSLVCDAVMMGLPAAVRAMLLALDEGNGLVSREAL